MAISNYKAQIWLSKRGRFPRKTKSVLVWTILIIGSGLTVINFIEFIRPSGLCKVSFSGIQIRMVFLVHRLISILYQCSGIFHHSIALMRHWPLVVVNTVGYNIVLKNAITNKFSIILIAGYNL